METQLVVLGGGPGRICGGISGRRHGHASHARRSRSSAGRHLLAQGLHSLESLAARGAGRRPKLAKCTNGASQFASPTVDVDAMRARKEK